MRYRVIWRSARPHSKHATKTGRDWPDIRVSRQLEAEAQLARDKGAECAHIYRKATSRRSGADDAGARAIPVYCSLAYSALACLRIGMSGSASFQSVKKVWYALFPLALSPDEVYALPRFRCASAPMGSSPTIPR